MYKKCVVGFLHKVVIKAEGTRTQICYCRNSHNKRALRPHSGVSNRRLLEKKLAVALNCLGKGVFKRRLREDISFQLH